VLKIGRVAACALVGACVAVGGAIADEGADSGFALPREVVSAATAFEGYMKSAAAIDGRFADGESVGQGLKAGVAYEPAQLEEGMIAYGAIAALQDDRFVEGVEAAGGHGEDRRAFSEKLIENPFAATRIDGAASAAQRIERALLERAGPLMDSGQQVTTAAYSVQRQAWSKVMVADAQDRLAEVKSLSAQRLAPSQSDNLQMMTRLTGADQRTLASDAQSGFSALEARALALAAEAVLGQAHSTDRDRIAPLFSETGSAQCLRMAKLNLYQCMAVAGPQYEDIWCLGQHAMYDTGACVDQAARGGRAIAANDRPAADARASYIPLAAERSLQAGD
jgi:hypothetical protein